MNKTITTEQDPHYSDTAFLLRLFMIIRENIVESEAYVMFGGIF